MKDLTNIKLELENRLDSELNDEIVSQITLNIGTDIYYELINKLLAIYSKLSLDSELELKVQQNLLNLKI